MPNDKTQTTKFRFTTRQVGCEMIAFGWSVRIMKPRFWRCTYVFRVVKVIYS